MLLQKQNQDYVRLMSLNDLTIATVSCSGITVSGALDDLNDKKILLQHLRKYGTNHIKHFLLSKWRGNTAVQTIRNSG